ncbi:MAG: molybdopterin molybdotransferase MoeA [Oscillospiraceae bacterium]|nr:molybdopterin molybdotransferase MoeA [Oscillospiraceae bacterium]
MLKSIPPEQARELLLSLPPRLPDIETLPLIDARGRVLAEDIVADIAIPPFDRSPFDGYAFRSADTASASETNPVTLTITEEIPAGSAPTIGIVSGYAAKILTGAPMPNGTDSTVKYEQTTFTATTVTFTSPVAPNSDVVYAGSDIAVGDIAAKRGDVITPALLGMFASLGRAAVSVYKRPRAAVINTGSELVEPPNPLTFGKIYNSNVFTLVAALQNLGFDAYNAGVVLDNPDLISQRIAENLPLCDVLITTGGASVGDYDFAVQSAEKLGAEILFWKTTIKPGGAMLASHVDGKLILALAGNPGSALMGLIHIARPFLRRAMGQTTLWEDPIDVYLRARTKSAERTRLIRGYLEFSEGRAWFAERGEQGGGALSSFAECDLLAAIPPNIPPIEAGTLIKAYRI